MSRFGSDPKFFFNSVYKETAPWDVDGPQPALAALLGEHPPEGPVLDVGCGSGDLAIYLAKCGLQVLGIDFADLAIEQAREKAAALAPEIARRLEFRVADALRPSRLERKFGSIVDSGFYHLFEEEVCDQFVDELALSLHPGGRYYLLAFAVEFSIPHSPRQVSEEELRARFSAERGWLIRDLRSEKFLSQIAPVPAISACIEREGSKHA